MRPMSEARNAKTSCLHYLSVTACLHFYELRFPHLQVVGPPVRSDVLNFYCLSYVLLQVVILLFGCVGNRELILVLPAHVSNYFCLCSSVLSLSCMSFDYCFL
jgi:hypothetical protein